MVSTITLFILPSNAFVSIEIDTLPALPGGVTLSKATGLAHPQDALAFLITSGRLPVLVKRKSYFTCWPALIVPKL